MRAFKTSIALLATLGLVACGSDSKSGQQVAPRLDAPVFGGTASLTLPGASEGTPCSLEWVPASGETKLSLSAAACDEKLLYGWYGGLPMTVQSAFSAPAGAVASATGHVECGELTDDVRGTVTDGVASFTWGAPAVQADTACTATLTVTVTAAGKSPSASSVSMPFTLHPAPVAQSLTASPAALTVVNGPAPVTPTSTLTATLLSLKLGSGLSEKASTSSTYAWTDTCGGTFAPADSASPVYTPPASGGATSKTCTIEVTVAVTATDAGETSDPVSSKASTTIDVSYLLPNAMTATLATAVFDGMNVVGVASDGAPDFGPGSFASNGIAKTDIHLAGLFDGDVTLGDIAGMSYWTKKDSTHAVNVADWYVNIYTKPYAEELSSAPSSWYGQRIGAEPYYAKDLNDPANTWNQWSTNGAQNQLRFYESTANVGFGTYTDPDWDTFLQGNSIALTGRPSVPYASQPILYISLQTGSATAAGFTGQLDGFQIWLKDGRSAIINFEP